jgi:DNA-binding HxlR family transcriptional regulator
MKVEYRCDCPITTGLDIIGDRWNLVIIKQMFIQKKKTFKEFLDSSENIASNILSTRLKFLLENEIITFKRLAEQKKIKIYTLTQKGLDLLPLIVEISIWSNKHLRKENPVMLTNQQIGIELIDEDKEQFIKVALENYKKLMSAY